MIIRQRTQALAVTWLWLSFGAGYSAAESAAEPQSMPWERWLLRSVLTISEGRTMMSRFLERQLQPLPLPGSRDAWLNRRAALHREVLTVLGIEDLVPPKWDLALQTQGTLQREGYRIEKITFQSYPGLTVPALLYVPVRVKGRVPGIVSISGHTATSKAADYVQQRNVNLVLRGCVVLSYDYYGYNDRSRIGDAPGDPNGANGHHLRNFSYTRRNATTLEVLDAFRAVDALIARPEVDPERIGFTGESGGSNTTYWVSAVDPRVKLSVPSCSTTTFDFWIRFDQNWDWHQRPPGIRRIADIGTLHALHAPRPLLVITGTRDRDFPQDEAEKAFQWARQVYRLLGAESAATHYISPTSHGYQEDKREQLYLAVERWLQAPNPQGGRELPVKVEPIEELRCILPENNLTFRAIFAEWLKLLPRTVKHGDPAALRVFLRERLGWPQTLPKVTAEKVLHEEKGHWSAEFWIVQSEPGIRLPAVLIGQKGAGAQVTLVPGRDKPAIARILEAGHQVVTFDLRGIGEMRDCTGGSWSRMAGPPWSKLLAEVNGNLSNWAWYAGHPWPGQWAIDLVQVARFCREKFGVAPSVEAENDFGWSALLAGAAAPEHFASGNVRIPWASLHEDVRRRGDQALADVPGILEHLDVPQLRDLWPAGNVVVE